MSVSHHTPNESTSRLYGSLVAPPATLTLPTVKFSRCQMMKSSSVRPPQRIIREENDEETFFFTWYFTVRARLLRFHSAAAQYTCTTSETSSTARITQSRPACGSIGSPMVRRCSAYVLYASWPAKALRLPYM